jgi:hypothetical protein
MAESGSWASIEKNGLLSTSALLDMYEVNGDDRERIEGRRRPESVPINRPGLPTAVIRDQIPMDDAGLLRCLPAHITPTDWYRLLNGKVFFWLTRDRLHRILNAGAYRHKEHDVLELDARALVEAHSERIWLCPMNSGCTKPIPHPRDETTFLRISDYPYSEWSKKRKRGERVVELCVDHSVPDIARFVTRVVSMRGQDKIRTILG